MTEAEAELATELIVQLRELAELLTERQNEKVQNLLDRVGDEMFGGEDE